MKVLLTGSSGLLGKYIKSMRFEYDIVSTWFTNMIDKDSLWLDITDYELCYYILHKVKPNIVIHCAAIGDVNLAEKNPEFVRKINLEGTKNLAECTREIGSRFVYLSSNAVYDGENPPYDENSVQKPINRYGVIKKQAEDSLKEIKKLDYIVYRPYMLYGYNYHNSRSNWFTSIHNNLRFNLQVKLVNDIYWQPTSVIDCVKVILKTMESLNTGESLNIAAPESMTLYNFGRIINNIFFKGRYKELIKPVNSEEFKNIAPRPKNTKYNLEKLHKIYGILKKPEDGLMDYIYE